MARVTAFHPEVLVHHQGHGQPAAGLEHGGHRGEQDRVPDRLPEDRVIGEGDEIAQAHEGGGAGNLSMEETEIDAVEERIAEECQQEQQRRREHEPGEYGFTLHERVEPSQPERPPGGRGQRARPGGLENLAHAYP
jgi:hypothetical protein